MSWFVGSCHIHSRTAHKRIWNKKSIGCKPCNIVRASFKRIFIACTSCNGYCIAACMDRNEQLVARLRLQGQYFLVDVCCCRFISNSYCIDNGKFPGNKSGSCKPGEKLENG